MNEKEANDIIFIAEGADGPLNRGEYGKMCHAHGYMEAIEKAKGLVEALEALRKHHQMIITGDHDLSTTGRIIESALAKYEKEK